MSTLTRRLRTVVAFTAGFVAATVVVATPAHAVNFGNEGCTPGYWKNHTDNWQEYDPDQTVGELSNHPGASMDWIDASSPLAAYNDWTLLQALQGGGGPGLDGAAKILLRASVAAYLNAAHEGLGYPYRRFGVQGGYPSPLETSIHNAFASLNRATMLALAKTLDTANNLGCPLNNTVEAPTSVS